ncbi:lytic transglycosylase domain-containing protein [Pandoraea pnomenusa]|nr:lytic transglycosylase domain-containing protein [Pandoraea pnomenusa]MBN9096176.1 lytic transglycosylase domain-containing protein [Pandoraea pnomenusa]
MSDRQAMKPDAAQVSPRVCRLSSLLIVGICASAMANSAQAEIYFRDAGRHRVVLSNRNDDGKWTPLIRVASHTYAGYSKRSEGRTRTVPTEFDSLIQSSAAQHNIDPSLLKAVISVESSFIPSAVSPKGAVGLMQLIPSTAAQYGVVADAQGSIADKLTNPETNVSAGARHLRGLIERFPGNLSLALAAYNAGEGAVRRYDNRLPPYEETHRYVSEVLARYEQFSAQHGK